MNQRSLIPATKPRIRLVNGRWLCESAEARAFSHHRRVAYVTWHAKVSKLGFTAPIGATKEN
jgi:hypothetical protein